MMTQPNTSRITQVLLQQIYKDVLGDFKTHREFLWKHRGGFAHYIKRGYKEQLLKPQICKGTFSLEKLSYALDPNRDLFLLDESNLDVTLYMLKDSSDMWIETPQYFWMRIAMGMTIIADNPTKSAIETYNVISTLKKLINKEALSSSGLAI